MSEQVPEQRIFTDIEEVITDMLVTAIMKTTEQASQPLAYDDALAKAEEIIDAYIESSGEGSDALKSEIGLIVHNSTLAHCAVYGDGKAHWSKSDIIVFIEKHPEFSLILKKEHLPAVQEMYQDGGGEGGAEDCNIVFEYKGIYYEYFYNYYSHYGYEFNSTELTHVLPRKVEVIQWFPA